MNSQTSTFESVSQTAPSMEQRFTPLQIYTVYRVFLSLILLLLSFIQSSSKTQTPYFNDQLYTSVAISYFLLNLFAVFFIQSDTDEGPSRSLLLITIDIIALTTLVHASGGISSNLAILLVITVAAGNVLMSGQMGILVAAIATLAMIYEQFYFSLSTSISIDDFTPAGFLGISFFGVSLFAQQLANRARDSAKLVEETTEQLAGLQHLNELIIQRMRTGILVLDERMKIILANQAAQQLLGQQNLINLDIQELSEQLREQMDLWKSNSAQPRKPFQINGLGPEITVNFALLSGGGAPGTLLFIEDSSQAARQAQSLKLASLGQFTASIAHEIRNPLSAISHAAQLLNESEALDNQDSHLSDIIQQHSFRINDIIENVLDLSRRQTSKFETILLPEWIEEFQEQLMTTSTENLQFENEWIDKKMKIRCDPSQLYQIINNLTSNGLRYSFKHTGKYQLKFRTYKDENTQLPTLEIIDTGAGILPENTKRLFEPFFTTEVDGTGLGLYLSRELCESNQAHIEYEPVENGGSCFRIIFAHSNRLLS